MILQEEEYCFSQNTLSPSKLQPKALSFLGDASGKTKTVNAEKVTIFFFSSSQLYRAATSVQSILAENLTDNTTRRSPDDRH